jgi:callose synthase
MVGGGASSFQDNRLDLRFFVFQYGIVYHLVITWNNTTIFVYLASWSYMLFAGILHFILSNANERYAASRHGLYRSIQALAIALITTLICMSLAHWLAQCEGRIHRKFLELNH